MQVQLSHPARTVEVKGPKKVKELLRELNLVVEAHLVIKGDDLVTEDEMLYDGDHQMRFDNEIQLAQEILDLLGAFDLDGSGWMAQLDLHRRIISRRYMREQGVWKQ